MIRKLTGVGLAVGALVSAQPAEAFLILGTDAAQAPGPETRIVVLREDTRSVVTVAASVIGPQKPLAIVLPLTKSAAASLRPAPITALERISSLTAPRADELWELDPCELHPSHQSAPPTPSAEPPGAKGPEGARTEGDFAITVLSEADSKAFAKWATDQGYRLPEGADSAIAGALKEGGVLAVARLDGARLTFDQGVARLPPLSFVVEGAPNLPLSLASLGARGPHDSIVEVLSPRARFEAENLMNMGVPTNLDITEDARSNLDGVHRAVLDFAFEKAPGAAVTEYAWLAAGCDGCESGKGLGAEDLHALGAEQLPSAEDGSQREVMVDVAEALARAPEGPPELKRSIAGCYAKTLKDMAGLEGSATITVQTGDGGAVTSATIKEASAEALGQCVATATKAVKLEHANKTGTIQARFALVSRAYLGGMVLSRLRVRATKGAAPDLKLRAAAAIEGGREEGPTGEAEKKVYFAEHANNYRARYVARHLWAGPIECDDPKRGVWGPKPKNAPSSPPGKPAPSASARATASASAGPSGKPAAPSAAEQKLQGYLLGGTLPDVQSYAISFRAPPAPPSPSATAAPSALSSAPSPAVSATGSAGSTDGCGCRTASTSSGGFFWVGLAGVAVLLGRRARRSRCG